MKKVIAIATAAAFVLSATPAFASNWNWNQSNPSSTVTVTNHNGAMVNNQVGTVANTGGNVTVGGNAHGNSANGGDASSHTGNATSVASVSNFVNTNLTDVSGACGCSSNGDNTVTVSSSNWSGVSNDVSTAANTGDNGTQGGAASSHGHSWFSFGGSANGGDAISYTGNATAGSSVVNVVGGNITRIH